MVLLMPPRAVNSPMTVAETGLQVRGQICCKSQADSPCLGHIERGGADTFINSL